MKRLISTHGVTLVLLTVVSTVALAQDGPYSREHEREHERERAHAPLVVTQAPGQGYTVVAPPADAQTAQAVPAAPAQPAQPAAAAPLAMPDPVIYPRSGQTAAQTEADRQACNGWATTQPGALADSSVFQRSVAACMDGRGYTVR